MKSLFLLLSALTAPAAMRTLEWDASPDHDRAAGYAVWEITPDGADRHLADTGILEHTLDLSPGEHVIFVTAFDAQGFHSDRSNLLTLTVLSPPSGLRVRVALQSSTDGETWTDEVAFIEDQERRKFYRATFTDIPNP
jgi:hypothetical protein